MYCRYDLDQLEVLFPGAYDEEFENITAHIFCISLGRLYGVNRRINQKAIESDPIYANGEWYAFQSKYYSKTTKLIRRKDDIIKDIRKVPQIITKLMFFVNKEFTEISNSDEKPVYILEIEREAKSHNLDIIWFTKRCIEQTLEMPEFSFIGERYFGSRRIIDYYKEAVKTIEEASQKGDVYGDIPLSKGYLVPHINVDGNRVSVQSFIENWIISHKRIMILFGEPGHGKTLLSWKAMYDFYKNGWLYNNVDNVFYFSLNPVYTSIVHDTALTIKPLLSWGFEREKKFEIGDCNNSLVILDGYDELADCNNSIDFDLFIRSIKRFQKTTNSYIIITSRKMAISSYLRDGHYLGDVSILAFELQPISRQEQIEWIDKYKKHIISENPESIVFNWNAYIKSFAKTFTNTDYSDIIGIPAVFRMIVASQYLPNASSDIVQIYEELFEHTMTRHSEDYSTTGKKKVVRQALQKLALAIFEDNTNTTLANNGDYSFWLFSFYTTRDGKERVGFYTRSLYQFFLAKEILSWYITYTDDSNYADFKKKLSCLSRRRLDDTTLEYLKILFHKKNKEYREKGENSSLKDSFVTAYSILKETDGFLSPANLSDIYSVSTDEGFFSPIPNDECYEHNKNIFDITPIERANNIFWNLVSIGSNCNQVITKNNINIRALQLYDLKGCILSGAELEGVSLVEAKLSKANFRDARLSGADFSCAHLREAIFNNADLTNTYFSDAKLKRAKFIGAQLRNAKMIGADLRDADFRSADIKNTFFSSSELSGAQFQAAHNRTKANWTDAKMIQATAVHLRNHGVDISAISVEPS